MYLQRCFIKKSDLRYIFLAIFGYQVFFWKIHSNQCPNPSVHTQHMLSALIFFRTNPHIFHCCLYVQITMIESMLSYFLESYLKDKIAENRQYLECEEVYFELILQASVFTQRLEY